jgi:hypothetical protein
MRKIMQGTCLKGRIKLYPYITGVSLGIPIQDSLAGGKYLLDIVSISGECDVLPSSKVGGDEVTSEEAMSATSIQLPYPMVRRTVPEAGVRKPQTYYD